MRNQKGFTIVELLIVVVVVVILAALMVTFVIGMKSGNTCDMYRYAPLSDVPAGCVDYFMNGEGQR